MKIKGYEDFIVWQKSMDVVELVYHATKAFPKRGTLRPDQPDSKGGCFYPVKHSGRPRAQFYSGIQAFSLDSAGFKS